MDAVHPDWVSSTLAQRILRLLDGPRTVSELVDDLDDITDSRVIFYLDALVDHGLVDRDDERRTRTRQGDAARGLTPAPTVTTTLPGSSVLDYEQAISDIGAGVFDEPVIFASSEHGARLRPERAAEFHGRLQALIDEYFGPDHADWTSPVKYGLRWLLTPIDLPPTSDERVRR